ncbi:MAG: kelch repeat-containing protein [Candidatus Acidiferrales bacterium]
MQRIARLAPLLVVVFVFALALPQFAFAQRLKPIPHPIGVMTHPTAEAQAQAQAGPEVHAQAKSASSSKTPPSPWTPLTNQPNFLLDGASVPILLTDGSVLIQDAAFPDWWKLTPDKFGSYVNGTWTQVASLPATYSPLYHSSAVLPDGRLIIEGGEYLLNADQTALVSTWTAQGSIYDPVANTWTPVAPPPFFTGFGPFPQTIGDERGSAQRNLHAGELLHGRRSVAQPEDSYIDANWFE